MTKDELTAAVFEERNLLEAEVQHLRNENAHLSAQLAVLKAEKADGDDWRQAWIEAQRQIAARAAAAHEIHKGWQPIETVPRDGTLVLGAVIVDGKVWRVYEMKHNGRAFYTRTGGSLPKMTHWQRMPPLEATS